MAELLQANWFLIVAALVIGLLVAWWIFVASRRTKVEIEESDESESKIAKRNQALIDAPHPATDKQDKGGATSAASPGALSAAANADNTATAPLGTDAEAGNGVPLRQAIADPATASEPAAEPALTEASDDLRRIKGVGAKLVTMLHEQGITSFAQIANWSDADIERVDAQLGRFQGRIRRDNWVEQARLLQDGDTAAYEAKFGSIS